MTDRDSDPLRKKLRTWKITPEISPAFQREVWQCIGARQSDRDGAFFFAAAHSLGHFLTQPRTALFLVILCVGGSVAIAHLQAQDSNAKAWRTLQARYASSIDPLAMKHAGQ